MRSVRGQPRTKKHFTRPARSCPSSGKRARLQNAPPKSLQPVRCSASQLCGHFATRQPHHAWPGLGGSSPRVPGPRRNRSGGLRGRTRRARADLAPMRRDPTAGFYSEPAKPVRLSMPQGHPSGLPLESAGGCSPTPRMFFKIQMSPGGPARSLVILLPSQCNGNTRLVLLLTLKT